MKSQIGCGRFILALSLGLFSLIGAGCSPATSQTGIGEPQIVDRVGQPRPLQGGVVVRSYDECVAAGYAVTRSIPPRCITPAGQQFTQQRAKPVGPGGCENRCGDGVCQQIVCMAVGCPCAETPVNCAQDCANSGF